MSRLIPQEMAKNGTAAEKSRMMVGGLKAYYSIGRGSQAFTRLARPKRKGAREGALDRSPLQFDKEQWGEASIYAYSLTGSSRSPESSSSN
jgi:hypothetical protein